ncbi:cell division protein ZapA [Hyphomicrobium sp.]|uniref:cell division protein ZapA n=1 Tax=Hyphomicrobium sp. TaxID=82 RepID=UPI002D77227E|nr:cell division protein ZapA [Hyphomicrobium sp.]HET6390069.1 cell division protein ZapA [Hyphomicrobium sp.]
MAEVPFTFNQRTYRFVCEEHDVQRLTDIVDYLKAKLDGLVLEHGAVGDERLILMAALMVTDELFDARADVDELLGEGPSEARSAAIRSIQADDAGTDHEDDDLEPVRRRAKG